MSSYQNVIQQFEDGLGKETITTVVTEKHSSEGVPTITTRTVTTTSGPRKLTDGNSSGGSSPETGKRGCFQACMGKRPGKTDKKDRKPGKHSSVKSNQRSKGSQNSDSDSDEEDFAKGCLKQHNVYRSKHGVPSLKLSKPMCKYAQEWAENCAKEDNLRHRDTRQYGENIYMKCSSDPEHKIPGKEPVESWYSEIKAHTFGTEPKSMGTGHFTQVVWMGSKEFGVGNAKSKSGKIYVVGNYDPPGNMIGSYAANVPPPK